MSRQGEPPSERRSSPGSTVDARQLWSGGAATALVAALIALVGILVYRWLLGIPILAPRQDGAWGDASTAGYAIAAAAAALSATAIMHLLLLTTPRPQMFFTWVVGLATVIAVVYPFSTTAPLSQKVGTAFIQPGARRRHRVADQRDRRTGDTAASGHQRPPAQLPVGGTRELSRRGRTGRRMPRLCQNRPETLVTNGDPRARREWDRASAARGRRTGGCS